MEVVLQDSAERKQKAPEDQILGREKERLEVLDEILERVGFATSLNSEIRRNVCKFLRVISIKSGEVIYRQGTPGDAYFIILSGIASVSVTTPQPVKESQLLAQLQAGDTFGEQALHDEHHRREATVECEDDMRVLKLTRADYQSAIHLAPADKETTDKVVFLRGVFLFRDLQDEELVKVAELMTERSCASNEIVAQQDDEIEEILMIVRGSVHGVLRAKRSSTSNQRRPGPQSAQRLKSSAVAPKRRGALSMELAGPVSQSRLVPESPIQEKDNASSTRLAGLLSKHRRTLVGKDRPSPVDKRLGVFEVTLAALRASKAERPPQLTQSDISALKNGDPLTRGASMFLPIYEGGKFDCVGERGLLKTPRHNMTFFTTTPTFFFVVSKFELLRTLSAFSVEAIAQKMPGELDPVALQQCMSHHAHWKNYKRRLVMQMRQCQ